MAASLVPDFLESEPDAGTSADRGPGQAAPARTRTINAWDGLPLHVHEWGLPRGQGRLPLLCLPGLMRTGADFARLAAGFAAERPIVALDYAGRGRSGRSRKVQRYAAEACVTDVLDLAAALHMPRVVAVGTSFGGILAMGIGAVRPTLLAAVVLNDVGPEIGSVGLEAIRRFLAETPDLADLEAAVRHLKHWLPDLGITSDDGWRDAARLTYAPDAGGKWRPLWDAKIARLLDAPVPDLWPFFGALAHLPVLVVRGGKSQLLLPETVERMQKEHPGLRVVEVPGVGHAPTLAEPAVHAALAHFLDELD